MKKIKFITTNRLVAGAFLIGGMSFGYAQDTLSTNSAERAQIAPSANPVTDALKKQIEANPNDTEAIVKLATAYQDAKDWNGALETWKKMSTLLPDWAPSYYSQAYVYQNMKDDANARTAYEKYIAAVKPEELEANKKNLAYAHFFVAYQLKDSNKEQAKQHLAKSLEYDNSNQDAVNLKEFLSK